MFSWHITKRYRRMHALGFSVALLSRSTPQTTPLILAMVKNRYDEADFKCGVYVGKLAATGSGLDEREFSLN